MIGQLFRGRPLRALMAAVTVSSALVVGSFGATPSGAAPVTKSITGTCSGADPASAALLAALGGNLTVPFEVTSDVPPTLQPEESGSPISFTWKVTLSPDVVNKAVGIDPVLTVKNLVLDMGVKGPTATTEVQGRPGPIDVALVANQPATIVQGPFSGTLEDVGKGGLIRYSPSTVSFTISVDLAGAPKDINVACAASGVVATTAIKIPGSPEIAPQPIVVEAQPNQTVTVDVLGQNVTPGVDEEGKTLPVDPSSLKVIDGPATVQDGKVVMTAGGPGTTTSATFEVCAGTLPGVDEVQRIVIDPSNFAKRRSVGFTLTYGGTETDVIWLARPYKGIFEPGGSLWGDILNLFGPGPYPYPKPTDWLQQWGPYFFTDLIAPTPEMLADALEALPGIGADGVEVTPVEGETWTFDIKFVGANGQKDVESIGVGNYYSILPRELLNQILEAAQGLLNNPDKPTTTLPDGLTLEQYAQQLQDEFNAALAAGDLVTAGAKLQAWVAILPDLILGSIDVDAVITFITSLFPSPPTVSTVVPGEDPIGICSQGVIDVTVASVAAATLLPTETPAAEPAAANTGAVVESAISFAG